MTVEKMNKSIQYVELIGEIKKMVPVLGRDLHYATYRVTKLCDEIAVPKLAKKFVTTALRRNCSTEELELIRGVEIDVYTLLKNGVTNLIEVENILTGDEL